MGNKGVLALRKQLKREQLHVVWLEQHLPYSRQLNSARQRVAQLQLLGCVVESAVLPTSETARFAAVRYTTDVRGANVVSAIQRAVALV